MTRRAIDERQRGGIGRALQTLELAISSSQQLSSPLAQSARHHSYQVLWRNHMQSHAVTCNHMQSHAITRTCSNECSASFQAFIALTFCAAWHAAWPGLGV